MTHKIGAAVDRAAHQADIRKRVHDQVSRQGAAIDKSATAAAQATIARIHAKVSEPHKGQRIDTQA